MKIPSYNIMNTKDVRTIPYDSAEQYQEELDQHWEEQQKLVKKNIGNKEIYTGCFFDGTIIQGELQILLQYLELKEGANFVRFEDGRYGFVGYYDTNETAFWLEQKKKMVKILSKQELNGAERFGECINCGCANNSVMKIEFHNE